MEVCGGGLDEVYGRDVGDWMPGGINIEMDGDAGCAQVIDPEYTGYDIAAHVVEYENFPCWFAVVVE